MNDKCYLIQNNAAVRVKLATQRPNKRLLAMQRVAQGARLRKLIGAFVAGGVALGALAAFLA